MSDDEEMSEEEAMMFLLGGGDEQEGNSSDGSSVSSSEDMDDDEAARLLAEMESSDDTSSDNKSVASKDEIGDDEAARLLAEMESPMPASTASKGETKKAAEEDEEDEAERLLAELGGADDTPVVAPKKQASQPSPSATQKSPASGSSEDDVGEIPEWQANEFQSDPSMLEDFVVNSDELMDTLDRTILELEGDPSNKDTIEEIFRAAHTLKGAAGMFGFKGLERVMHRMENMFDQVRKGKLVPNSGHIDVVFQGLDIVKKLVEAIKAGTPSGIETAPIVNALSRAAKGEIVSAKSESSPKAAKTESSGNTTGGGGGASAGPKKGATKNNETSTIRVDLKRLDVLVNLIGELVIDRTRFTAVEDDLRTNHPQIKASAILQETTQLFARHMNEIQNIIMTVRMVPIGNAFNKYPRIVRDLARGLGKQMDLVISGESAELDKTLVEQIGDPLVHLIRNACDHGIEMPEVRQKAGKSPMGVIMLSAHQEGNNIVIMIEDDGKGMDPEIIKKKAIEKGLISETSNLSNSEIFSLIFEPGFSTAEKVTEVSGRGVGMDVVKKKIMKLKGSVDIDSVVGRGTKLKISLPLTLAIVKSLLVKVGDETYAIPSNSIVESIRINKKEIQKVGDSEVIKLRKKVLPLMHLNETLKLESKKGGLVDLICAEKRQKVGQIKESRHSDRVFIVVVGSGERRFGIVVDKLLNQQEMVIKSMGPLLKNIPCVSGGAVLGQGEVVLVLDVAEMEDSFREKARRGKIAA